MTFSNCNLKLLILISNECLIFFIINEESSLKIHDKIPEIKVSIKIHVLSNNSFRNHIR